LIAPPRHRQKIPVVTLIRLCNIATMPVSKHRRGSHTRTRKPPAPAAVPQNVMTIAELRREITSPDLDFPARTTRAGVWWFQQLLARVGDHWQANKASRKDRQTAAMLLCVAMDGEHGANDDLAPVLAEMLRPYRPAASFTESWEQAKQLSPGTVRTVTAKVLTIPGRPPPYK
jgi:hypothetical protein